MEAQQSLEKRRDPSSYPTMHPGYYGFTDRMHQALSTTLHVGYYSLPDAKGSWETWHPKQSDTSIAE